MNNSQVTATKERLDLLSEIEQTPEEYIPKLLKIVRLLRQTAIAKQKSLTAWDNAIKQLDDSERELEKQEKIKQLFQSWLELDERSEQKETLKVIELIEGVSM